MYWIYASIAASSSHPASYTVSVRTVGISPRTSSPTVRYLPAAVLQVCDSASSRLVTDFHRRSHIASVVHRVGGFRPLSHHRTCELPHTAVSKLLTPVRSAQFLLPRHELLFLPCQTLARRSYPPRGHTGPSFRPSRAADYLVL